MELILMGLVAAVIGVIRAVCAGLDEMPTNYPAQLPTYSKE